jgi:RNA-directed DNA polymerase
MSGPKPDGKPFVISKRLVWEAWRRVKANRGAAGVDEESILAFEANLRGNLYKVWNRMSSGSYVPPPVRAVEIPKKSGGSRMLGVPTVADRVAQTVAYLYLEPEVEPCSTGIPMGIGRDGRLMTRWGHVGSGVGGMTGF